MSLPPVIDEHGLDEFRQRHLSPQALLELVEHNVHVIAQLPVGVGKSHAVDQLLESPLLFERFDRVIYAAPTWGILDERHVVRDPAVCPEPPLVLRPRPRTRCGGRDGEWSDLERRSCSAYAKATVCAGCPNRGDLPDRCAWPDQFRDALDHRLLLMPEQQLMVNRMLVPLLKPVARAGRILVILDEARLFDAPFEVVVQRDHLEHFRDVVEAIGRTAAHERWVATINQLLGHGDLRAQLDLPAGLHRDAVEIQRTGVAMFGRDFHNLAYDLTLLGASRAHERWRHAADLRFIGRPLLQCHVLALSANLAAEYAGDRLGSGRIASPFAGTVFRHSQTRIINLRSRLGADRYFRKNQRQVLDTIAVMIGRNIELGRSTLLISKKRSKARCVEYLVERLNGWGCKVRFVCEKFDQLPPTPSPVVIPVIHYGTLGVNSFEGYESAFCVNSYYVSPATLNGAVQEASSQADQVTLEIRSGPERIRRPVVIEGADPAGVVAKTAGFYLDKLELDPVVQAVGRVRYVTRPREILVFQMADMTPQLGDHVVVESLSELRELLGLAEAREVSERIEGANYEGQVEAGCTVAQVAAAAGVSERTVYRRLRAHRTDSSPTNIFIRQYGSCGSGEEAGA